MTSPDWFETQLDGLVGPTHNYAGLSHGNVASQAHAQSISAPKQAALQGLAKMRFVHGLGIRQLVAPPQPRPNLRWLHRLGFSGSVTQVLDAAWETSPALLYQAYSASSMWAANMATVTPSPDSVDGRLHLTPANLCTTAHRTQEPDFSHPMLQAMFGTVADIHAPLPASLAFSDEGAANHMRFAASIGEAGVEVFVHGRSASRPDAPRPRRYPARQTLESVEAIARLHRLPPERCVFVQQHPDAIDAGVFHNDVIAMSHGLLLIYHERAYLDEEAFLSELRAKLAPHPLTALRIAEADLPLQDAVRSYFFNSQIVQQPDGMLAIIAPSECEQIPAAHDCLERLRAANDNAVGAIHYLDVRESMKNGGGPACLRLRLPMSDAQWQALPTDFQWSETLDRQLTAWIEAHYRDRLAADDLRDPGFAEEAAKAYETLQQIFPTLPIINN